MRASRFREGPAMPAEPDHKRVVTFFDGQNLFHAAKRAFGHAYPSYDPVALSRLICDRHDDWGLYGVRFYTGVPDAADQPFWNHFWTAKGAQMGREGVTLFTRRLMYRNKKIRLPDGSKVSVLTGDEKGVDTRIAIDVIRGAHRKEYDVAVIFSQDQDLSEAVDEVKVISMEQDRWIKTCCAFPSSPAVPNARGINKTDWIRLERADYDNCLDARDYRPKEAV
jgi:uncharacterized LabA/DUF88 family protein